MRSKPQLIVPIRDRRSRKRVLTLKNFRNVVIAIVVLLLAVTIQSDLRHPKAGEYGRLFGKQVSGQPEVAPQKTEVIREAPVPEQPAADPLLISSAARGQYLGVNNTLPPPPPALNDAVPPPPVKTGTGPVTIVGGAEGVTIVRGDGKKQPTLSGGIFRK